MNVVSTEPIGGFDVEIESASHDNRFYSYEIVLTFKDKSYFYNTNYYM